MRPRTQPQLRRALVVAPVLAGLLTGAVACSRGAPVTIPAPTATAIRVPPTATALAPSPTPTRLTATATPVPIARPTGSPATMPALHPPGVRTGNALVDAVVDAFLGNSLDVRRRLVRFLKTPCTTTVGMGGPPKCAAGEANGTPVEVFPFVAAEGEFARRDSLDRLLQFEVAGLYGVFRVPASAFRADYWPAGEFGVVFSSRVATPSPAEVIQTIVYVQDGTVVCLRRTPFAETWPPQEASGAEWVLQPVR